MLELKRIYYKDLEKGRDYPLIFKRDLVNIFFLLKIFPKYCLLIELR